MTDLITPDEQIMLLLAGVILLFIGPSLTVLFRGCPGLTDFLVLNALAFAMPAALIVIWPLAFLWPGPLPPIPHPKPSPRRPLPGPPQGGVTLMSSRRVPD
ncbi:hypothetical protein EDD29_5742 [Actinocorallia herbida]|uniref:Uncharacterized protein n=1 Tax=Actinocorallia herbida TaxID=58109 RepID=A0A3N1D3I4_9ACTN|nr:hypothetical protein [Actinocorallia herbida]ROO88085.1 hypothetical protein EDD29_5742 [Actinocorallia herbida]